MRSAMPWLWPSLTNKSLRVATHVDLRVSNVLSQRDLRAFKVLVWEVDALPVVCEDIVAAWVALESMMLPSGAELPKSLTDHGNYGSCWVQTVAFEWWEDVHHSYPRPRNWHGINVSMTCVAHEENTGWRHCPFCQNGLAHMRKSICLDVAQTWKVNWHEPDVLPVAKLEMNH